MARGEFDIDEAVEISWINHLDGFFTEFYPILEKHGVSRGEALMVYAINQMTNSVDDLGDAVRELTEELREA